MSELQPDVQDVLQEEPEARTAVPMCIVDQTTPVRTQALPRKGGSTMTRPVDVTPVRVLFADHRRAVARMVASVPFLVAFTETAAQSESTMCLVPAGVVLDHHATTEVWLAVPADPGTAGVVGIATELWAEGE